MSFEVILPFLRPIEHLILDGEISEIMVNGSSRVFIERRGRLERTNVVFNDEPHETSEVGYRRLSPAMAGVDHRPDLP